MKVLDEKTGCVIQELSFDHSVRQDAKGSEVSSAVVN
jgi:hypothetical protein